ncbi:MAG TPA: putative ABC exporter domain-containing protein [Candidatus Acidoferrales bacterium]|nr:putative ABC exporter domain-containing protein [Candidatus Acidoferrales bacterium]
MYALARLEWEFLRNNVLEICRSPLRLALWGGYGILLLGAGAYRLHASLSAAPETPLLTPALATAIGGAILAMFGGSVACYAIGQIGAFRSRAEALLFVNVGLSSQMIATWLQARKLISTLSRWLWTIILNFVIFLPAHARGGELARGFAASILTAMVVMSVEIPVFLLGRMKFGMLFVISGAFATLVGFFYLVLGLGATLGNDTLVSILTRLPFTPATPVFTLIDGPIGYLAAYAALPFVFSLSVFALGHDAIPELYSASVRWFSIVSRRRSLTQNVHFNRHREMFTHRFVGSGPLVLIWKDWLAFRRRRGGTLVWLLLFAISLTLGTTMAALATQTHHESDGWALLSVMSAFIYFVPLFASIGLADDIGKPLFWMTTPSLVAALMAWTFARSWRGALIVGAAPLVAGVGMGDRTAVLLSVPLTVVLWFSLTAVGVFIYALFPSRFDARGPLFFVRLFVAFALLVPGLFVFTAAVIAYHNFFAALISTGVTFALEAALCLILAATLLQQNGAGVALLKRAS